jgi:hypothetical protein
MSHLDRVNAQSGVLLAEALADIDQASQVPPEGTLTPLRAGLEALRDWLGQQADTEAAAAAVAQGRADRALAAGHPRAAEVDLIVVNRHTGESQMYRNRQSDVNALLAHDDSELQAFAVSELGYWLQLSTDQASVAQDAAATLQQPNLTHQEQVDWSGVYAYNAARSNADAKAALGLWQVIYLGA